MIFGLVVAAGNQTRFKDDKPKALVDINGTPLFELNRDTLNKYCDKTYIVTSFKNDKHFLKYDNRLSINSGFGSGDAIYKSLKLLNLEDEDTCFIVWGDCLIDEKIIAKLIEKYRDKDKIYIACEECDNPYVGISNINNKTVVKFSKFGENTAGMVHDLSIFYGNAKFILSKLDEFRHKTFYDDEYHHKHNNELEFLDLFNDVDVQAEIVIFDDVKTLSFNTKEELKAATSILKNYYYEPKSGNVKLEDTLDLTEYKKFEDKIDNDSNLSVTEKRMLKLLATKHIEFKYGKIADFYTNAPDNIKNYLEDLRVVILDTDKAIEKGLFKYFDNYEKLIGDITGEK